MTSQGRSVGTDAQLNHLPRLHTRIAMALARGREHRPGYLSSRFGLVLKQENRLTCEETDGDLDAQHLKIGARRAGRKSTAQVRSSFSSTFKAVQRPLPASSVVASGSWRRLRGKILLDYARVVDSGTVWQPRRHDQFAFAVTLTCRPPSKAKKAKTMNSGTFPKYRWRRHGPGARLSGRPLVRSLPLALSVEARIQRVRG